MLAFGFSSPHEKQETWMTAAAKFEWTWFVERGTIRSCAQLSRDIHSILLVPAIKGTSFIGPDVAGLLTSHLRVRISTQGAAAGLASIVWAFGKPVAVVQGVRGYMKRGLAKSLARPRQVLVSRTPLRGLQYKGYEAT